jgi:uncharacterized membrane protein YphA (DoxX/SURF4 family)
MNVTLTPAIIYSGLGLCLLFVMLAAYQQKCSAKVFFILTLRLAIGWHFMFEGLHKIHSYYVGPTDSNRVFTSEPYFAMADGPLGPIVRKRIGDPSEIIARRIVAKSGVTLSDPAKDTDLLKAVPDEVAAEWYEYAAKYEATYGTIEDPLPPGQITLIDRLLAQYGAWVVGKDKGRESKIRYVQSDVPINVPQRLEHIKKLEQQLAELTARIEPGLGQGYGYDQKRMTAAKNELTAARADLIADGEAVLTDMKRALFANATGKRVLAFPAPSATFSDAAKFNALLAFSPPGGTPTFETTVPPDVRTLWTGYLDAVHKTYRLSETEKAKVDANADFWNQQLADWYAKDPLKKFKADYDAAVKADKKDEIEKARGAYLAELDKQFATFKTTTNNMLSAETLSGIVPVKKVKPIEQMDKVTMYFIAIVGACIFFGLFTRIACLAAVGFLVMTYLTHPPFPWLPLPPNTEGNPLFINKNVIEALALMVIVVHPTGKWLGLDSLLYRLILKK